MGIGLNHWEWEGWNWGKTFPRVSIGEVGAIIVFSWDCRVARNACVWPAICTVSDAIENRIPTRCLFFVAERNDEITGGNPLPVITDVNPDVVDSDATHAANQILALYGEPQWRHAVVTPWNTVKSTSITGRPLTDAKELSDDVKLPLHLCKVR